MTRVGVLTCTCVCASISPQGRAKPIDLVSAGLALLPLHNMPIKGAMEEEDVERALELRINQPADLFISLNDRELSLLPLPSCPTPY